MRKFICASVLLLVFNPGISQTTSQLWNELASPDIDSIWVLPAQGKPAHDSLGTVHGKEEYPASGIISDEVGVQSLTVFIFVKPFLISIRI